MKELIRIYEKMGMINVSTKIQEDNGTIRFFDNVGNCNYVFRESSCPRVEYFSDKTNNVQSYSLYRSSLQRSSHSIEDDLLESIPYIVDRKIKGLKKRMKITLELTNKLIGI